MESSWPESVLSNRERVMEELVQGRELVGQLYKVLDNHKSTLGSGGNVGEAEGLVNKILGSFANTLLILNGKESDQDELVSKEFQVDNGGGSGGYGAADSSSSWDTNHHGHAAIKCEDLHEESCKSTSTFKDRRGSYKRRKTSHSWTRDAPALTDDGHAWRKYGQKVILNTNHPRNYFRCTHKFDQACKATKHVQKIQDNPSVFRTTYYGNHTCRDYLKTSELVLECTSPRDPSKFISFDSSKQDHPLSSLFTTPVKNEAIAKEEKTSRDHMMTSHQNHSSSCDYLVSLDLFECSGPMSGFSSTMDQYDQEDVISGILAGSYDFDAEVLQYMNV